jgi:Tfp pilus assembly protein PilX
VCLLVVSLVVAGALRALATDQRQLRTRRDRLQAELLAESGIERAAAAVRASKEYAGESWRIAADELRGASDGLVLVRVEKSEQAPRRRVVTVQADYPAGSEHRVRVNKQVVVDL